MDVGKRVKRLREKAGWSQGVLGEKSGVDPSYISLLENGKRSNPGVDAVQRLASALGTTVAYLVGEINDPRPISQFTQAKEHPVFARVKSLAESKGLSYADILTQIKTTEADIALIDPDDPDPHTLWPIAAALGTSMAYLNGETDDPRPILGPGQATHNRSALYDPGVELLPEDIQDLERAYLEIERRRAERKRQNRDRGQG